MFSVAMSHLFLFPPATRAMSADLSGGKKDQMDDYTKRDVSEVGVR